MKALIGAFNQEKALVGAFSVIVQPVVEPMEHYTALVPGHHPHTEMESCLHSAAAQDPAHCSPASAVRSSGHFVTCAVTVS